MTKVIDTYYEFNLFGDTSEGRYKSREQAIAAANNEHAAHIVDSCYPSNGEVWEETIDILEVTVFEDGDVSVKDTDVEIQYEHYHGDRAEHFNQGDYI